VPSRNELYAGMEHKAPPRNAFASDRSAVLNSLASTLAFVPGVGDVAGLAADADMYATDPKSRNWKNYLMTGLGALPFVPGAAHAIFAGPLAKTADISALERAKAMAKMGTADDAIWKETGWWVNTPDGVPRFEIDDSVASYAPGAEFSRLTKQHDDQWMEAEDASILAHQMSTAGISVGDAKEWFRQTFNRDPHEGAGLWAKSVDKSQLADRAEEMASRPVPKRSKWDSTLGRVMPHDALYEAYPEMSRAGFGVVGPGELGLGTAGQWDGANMQIRDLDAYGLDSGKSITLHETQHGVQGLEGMARGGNEDMASAPLYDAINTQLSSISREMDALRLGMAEGRVSMLPGQHELQQLERKYYGLMDQRSSIDPRDAYKRLAGEAEARAVQTRRDFTEQMRRETPPWQSYDVPLNSLIVRK
jgi:hypothetical protein